MNFQRKQGTLGLTSIYLLDSSLVLDDFYIWQCSIISTFLLLLANLVLYLTVSGKYDKPQTFLSLYLQIEVNYENCFVLLIN